MNLNILLQLIIKNPNVKVGSTSWIEGGLHPKSYQTGGHPAYGWKHDHIINTSTTIENILSNYGLRPVYYTEEPLRKLNYGEAGRPINYIPENPGDQIDGHVLIDGILISGLDLHHFHISPLIAVYDSQLATNEQKQLAAWMIRGLMASLAGQLRKADPNYWLGDRVFANVIKAAMQAAKRGLILTEDIAPIFAFYEKALTRFEGPIPKQESDKHAQGVTPDVVLSGNDPWYYQQIYNGLYWYLPAVYDALSVIGGDLKTRSEVLVKRWSRHIQDLNLLAGSKFGSISGVSFPNSMIGSIDESWLNVTLHYAGTSPEWAIRAIFVAAEVLKDSNLLKSANEMLKTSTLKEWNVNAANAYQVAVTSK